MLKLLDKKNKFMKFKLTKILNELNMSYLRGNNLYTEHYFDKIFREQEREIHDLFLLQNNETHLSFFQFVHLVYYFGYDSPGSLLNSVFSNTNLSQNVILYLHHQIKYEIVPQMFLIRQLCITALEEQIYFIHDAQDFITTYSNPLSYTTQTIIVQRNIMDEEYVFRKGNLCKYEYVFNGNDKSIIDFINKSIEDIKDYYAEKMKKLTSDIIVRKKYAKHLKDIYIQLEDADRNKNEFFDNYLFNWASHKFVVLGNLDPFIYFLWNHIPEGKLTFGNNHEKYKIKIKQLLSKICQLCITGVILDVVLRPDSDFFSNIMHLHFKTKSYKQLYRELRENPNRVHKNNKEIYILTPPGPKVHGWETVLCHGRAGYYHVRKTYVLDREAKKIVSELYKISRKIEKHFFNMIKLIDAKAHKGYK